MPVCNSLFSFLLNEKIRGSTVYSRKKKLVNAMPRCIDIALSNLARSLVYRPAPLQACTARTLCAPAACRRAVVQEAGERAAMIPSTPPQQPASRARRARGWFWLAASTSTLESRPPPPATAPRTPHPTLSAAGIIAENRSCACRRRFCYLLGPDPDHSFPLDAATADLMR